MAKNDNPDNPLLRFIDHVSDIIFLSVFWVIGCIPILTIGTSTTALYYATMKSIWGEGSVSKNFFKSYKENLKQSVLAELVILTLAALMYALIKAAAGMAGAAAVIPQILFAALLFLCAVVGSYLFPLLSRFNQTVTALFRNAFLISFSHFPYTVAITILNVIPLAVFLLWPAGFMRLLLVMLFLAPGLIARINAGLLIRVFACYGPQDEAEEDANSL